MGWCRDDSVEIYGVVVWYRVTVWWVEGVI